MNLKEDYIYNVTFLLLQIPQHNVKGTAKACIFLKTQKCYVTLPPCVACVQQDSDFLTPTFP